MAKMTFNDFITKVINHAESGGALLNFGDIPSYVYPKFYYSGSWNQVLDRAIPLVGEYTPKGKVPFSDKNLYSSLRVVRLSDFLHDLQVAVASGKTVKKILNPDSRVKPFYSQLNVVFSTEYVPVVGFRIKNPSVVGNVGEQTQLEWEIIPPNATDKEVTFTMDDTTVAEVSEEGLVTLLSVGQTRVTGKINGNSTSIGVVAKE